MNWTVAAVAPAAPAAGYAVLGIGLVISFVVAWGLQSAWRATFGPLLTWLGNLGISAGRGVFKINVHPFRFALRANTAIERWLSQAVALSERGMVWLLGNALQLLLLVVHTTEQAARDTYQWGAHVGLRIHALEAAAIHGISHIIGGFVHAVVAKAIAVERRVYDRSFHRTDARVGALERTIHGKGHAGFESATFAPALPRVKTPSLADQIAAPWGRTAKQIRRLARRTSALEEATVGLGAVALVAAALGRMGLGFLRCPSLLRMGKRLGCVGFGWLEGFFATAFEALVVLDLCRFALAAQQLARVLVPQLAGTLLVQNAVCLGGGAQYPSAHDSPKVVTRLVLPSAHD